MTDNEFIKAIKFCSRQDNCNTASCPIYRDMGDDEDCATKICKCATDLIKRKDAEIDILIRKKEALRDELAEKQAEIERLKKGHLLYDSEV